MLVLITYDVKTSTSDGKKRLQKVAKTCVNFGQRVQNSVFECSVDPAQLVEIKHEIERIIDNSCDNVRIYHMGKHWERKIETLGKSESYNPDNGTLFL